MSESIYTDSFTNIPSKIYSVRSVCEVVKKKKIHFQIEPIKLLQVKNQCNQQHIILINAL